VRQLERRRDDCLVAILQALREQGVGAGAVLARHERALMGAAAAEEASDGAGRPLHRMRVPPEWIDYNGHLHESRYLQLFGDATDGLLARIGVDADYLDAGRSYYTVETHLSHLDEASAGDQLEVATQILGADDKRLHLFHEMRRDGTVVATAEQMLLHVDTAAGRTTPADGHVRRRVGELAARHAALPRPERAGRAIAGGLASA
jgi:carnitine 3-dehydrogenase